MPQTHGILKAALRRLPRIGVTAAFVVASAGLVVGGRMVLAERGTMAAAPMAIVPQSVAVARIEMQDGYSIRRAFTGQLEPAQRTAAGFELAGTIAAVFVDEGDAVAAGAPLAQLDPRLLEAERDRLQAARMAVAAQAELAARTSQRQTELRARGVASPQALDAASLQTAELAARIAEIDASLQAVAIRLEKTTITAPFDAIVAVRHLDVGASAGPGRPVVSLAATTGPVFRVGLPPDALRAIPIDGAVTIHAEGTLLEAKLRAVLPDLDAATRTRTALFAVADAALPAWRSIALLQIEDHVPARGAWVPLAALEAGPRGLWRLLTVVERDGRHVVGAETVEILHATAERAFVRGTVDDGALFVADGPHRVVPSQWVRPAGPGA